MSGLEAATHIEVEAEVRYWEDASVNGVDDEDGTLIPGRVGDLWKARIRLADGQVEGWPVGTTAEIHYKVCDAGLYWLTDEAGVRIAKWAGDYVPSSFLCHGDSGYGDYIILTVNGDGLIEAYDPPRVDSEDWPALPVSPPPARAKGMGV
jgi:hypothetical protein